VKIADQLADALRLARQYVLYGIKDSTGSIRAIASRHLTLLDAALAAYDAALSAAPEADTILSIRDTLRDHYASQGRPAGEEALLFAAICDFASALLEDAQKAPQPRTAPEQTLPSFVRRPIEEAIASVSSPSRGMGVHDGTVRVASDKLAYLLRAYDLLAQKAPQPRTAEPAIDTADHILHRPSGETWLVAMVEGDRLTACGWPESMVPVAECELLRKATPAERVKLLHDMARSSGRRAIYAQSMLAEPAPAPAAQPRTAEPGQPERRWPFVESPEYFAGRLAGAHAQFHGDMLAAVRSVLIEEPPALAAPAEPAPAPADEPPPLQAARAASPVPAAVEMTAEFTDTSRAALAWVLWHHQGASSEIGQAMRFALGMGRTDHLSERQVAEAKRWAALSTKPAMLAASPPAPPTPQPAAQPLTWTPMHEQAPPIDTDCAVMARYTLDQPPFVTLDRWEIQHEDPTGMGGPTIETGYGWNNNHENDVIAWLALPPRPPAEWDQRLESAAQALQEGETR
jgi:hypothetical protein